MMNADEILDFLNLEPLSGEGGYYRETYRSAQQFGDKSISTAIYYFLTPETCSAMHKLPFDEIFHFYLGDPVEMLQLHPDGSSDLFTIGTDLLAGHRPQRLVPAGSWQGSRLLQGGAFALMGTTMAPAFDFSDYVGGQREPLLRGWPARAAMIEILT